MVEYKDCCECQYDISTGNVFSYFLNLELKNLRSVNLQVTVNSQKQKGWFLTKCWIFYHTLLIILNSITVSTVSCF